MSDAAADEQATRLGLGYDPARIAVAPTPWTVRDVITGDGARYYRVLDRAGSGGTGAQN